MGLSAGGLRCKGSCTAEPGNHTFCLRRFANSPMRPPSPAFPTDADILSLLDASFSHIGVFPPDSPPNPSTAPPPSNSAHVPVPGTTTNAASSIRPFSYSLSVRTIKHLFALRDYAAIFSNPDHPEYLPVYSAEYSAGRALAYAELFGSVEELKVKIDCVGIGGGTIEKKQ